MSADMTTPNLARPAVWKRGSRAILAAAVLAVGAAGGFGVGHYVDRAYPQAVLLQQPVPIAKVDKAGPVAFKGTVAEIFGGKFILQDDSGRALIDTGPRGDTARALARGETVTAQGYFDHGVLHANVLTRADGSTEAFGPPGPPPRGPNRRPPPPGGPGARPPAPDSADAAPAL